MKGPRPERVLGIDPGTRYLGTAVLEGRELIHHQVFEIWECRPQQTLAAARKVVGRLIEAYQPEAVVIERIFFSASSHSGLLRLVADEIQSLAEALGVRVVLVSPSTAKKRVTGDGNASKARVASAICQGYPRLRAFLGLNRKWKTRYHSNMFDAIAVAATALTKEQANVK